MLGEKPLSYQPPNEDYDRIRSQGVMRIAALAQRLNDNPRIAPEVFKERMKDITDNYFLSEEDAGEVLSDVSMALKKGKTAFDYVREGQPSFSVKTGRWLKYLKGVDPKEYESVWRSVHLSREAQEKLLNDPAGMVQDYAPGEKEAILAKGQRAKLSAREAVDDTKPKVVF